MMSTNHNNSATATTKELYVNALPTTLPNGFNTNISGINNTTKKEYSLDTPSEWLEMYQQLFSFYKSNGHVVLSPPNTAAAATSNKLHQHLMLCNWVVKQRMLLLVLPEYYKELLDGLGFVWSSTPESQFYEHLQRFEMYAKHYGPLRIAVLLKMQAQQQELMQKQVHSEKEDSVVYAAVNRMKVQCPGLMYWLQQQVTEILQSINPSRQQQLLFSIPNTNWDGIVAPPSTHSAALTSKYPNAAAGNPSIKSSRGSNSSTYPNAHRGSRGVATNRHADRDVVTKEDSTAAAAAAIPHTSVSSRLNLPTADVMQDDDDDNVAMQEQQQQQQRLHQQRSLPTDPVDAPMETTSDIPTNEHSLQRRLQQLQTNATPASFTAAVDLPIPPVKLTIPALQQAFAEYKILNGASLVPVTHTNRSFAEALAKADVDDGSVESTKSILIGIAKHWSSNLNTLSRLIRQPNWDSNLATVREQNTSFVGWLDRMLQARLSGTLSANRELELDTIGFTLGKEGVSNSVESGDGGGDEDDADSRGRGPSTNT